MMKLLELWAILGVKVMGGYVAFIERFGNATIIVSPLIILGFVIPWVMVYGVLLGLNIVQGWFVYDLTFKEQIDAVKEVFMDGVNNFREM